MKRLILASLAAVVVVLPAHARLGETVDEIATRYGSSTTGLIPVEYVRRDYGETQAWYEKDDVKLLVVFKNGKSRYELLSSKDPAAKLSHSVVTAFLDANSGASTWLAPKETPAGTNWARTDGGARAVLAAESKTLAVMITKGGSEGF